MELLESIKRKFLKQPQDYEDFAREVPQDKIQHNLTSDEYFINNSKLYDGYNSHFDSFYQKETSQKQTDKINTYRTIASYPEVSSAIDEIVNEIIYTPDFKECLNIEVQEIENTKLQELIIQKFNKILRLLNIRKNFYQIVKDSYIDGQINLYLDYGKVSEDIESDSSKRGIRNIVYIDPRYLVMNQQEGTIKYVDTEESFGKHFRFNFKNLEAIKAEYNIEQIVHMDFGLKNDDNVILSYLENSIKSANTLKTLEDLLVPLRFSRSVSRRVFNVDVSSLPNSKAEAYMRKLTENFKYKKFYNSETGEVTNQQHITSLVEDYWMGNRNGGKGMQVDVLDESGNLGEIGDILYFKRKLYTSLGIPASRVLDEEGNNTPFDFESSQVTQEDIKFYMFINRLRLCYVELIKLILKRELVSTKILTEKEYEVLKEKIQIYFTGQNQFMERLNLSIFLKRLDAFQQAREFAGKVFSVKTLFKEIFKYDDDEIIEILKEIQKEEADPLYAKFYPKEEIY